MLKPFHYLIILIGIISAVFFSNILFFIPPKIDGQLVLSNVFYLLASGTTVIAVLVTFVLYIFEVSTQPKALFLKKEFSLNKIFFTSLRRGVLLALTALGIALLRLFGLLNILNTALILGIAVLAEIYFSGR